MDPMKGKKMEAQLELPKAGKAAPAIENMSKNITVYEGRAAPEGYAFKHKRLMKNCRSCVWWTRHVDARIQITPTKRKKHACTHCPTDEHGLFKYDPYSGVREKGDHYGERTDPLFHCKNFRGKTMPLVKLPEDEE